MENKNELQDLNLDEMLSELHELVDENVAAEVEPDEELQKLLDLPELTITPVVVRSSQMLADTAVLPAMEDLVPGTTEVIPDLSEITTVMPALQPEALAEDTVAFTPIAEETAAFTPVAEETVAFTPITEETAAFTPVAEETAAAGDAAEELLQNATTKLPTDDAVTKVMEPAFEVEEEFTPSPILFAPRSRLRELKKDLVAGPEKRYYELSEIGTGKLQMALLLNVIVVLTCIAVTTMFTLNMVPENRLRLVIFSQVLAMLVSALLGSHLMIDALSDLLKGRFTVNTLLTLTFAACLVDGIFCLMDLRIPCCAAFSLEMTMALWARLQKRNTELAQLDTMRKAVRLNGIVKVDDYYDGKDGLLRKDASVADFMDIYQKPSTPEVTQSVYAALGLLASIAIAVFAGLRHGVPMAVQILSTSLLVAVPASFFVSITRPTAILETRLHMVGTVLCGWAGVRDLVGKAVFPLRDQDLFPQGSIKLNGVKFYGDRDPNEVVSYTASLISVSGGGLVPVFQQLLKNRNGVQMPVDTYRNYGQGGIGGEIQGEPVLLGTLSFLRDMGVQIPEETAVNQAVYAAIDGQLCAVYAISYAKMRSAAAGLVTLCGYRKLTLLKLPGDFMVDENFLRNKFSIKSNRVVFPDYEMGTLLSRFHPDPEEPVLAITTREELISAAYAVTGARALRQSTKLGVTIHLIGGILGLVIMLVLGYLGSTELLTPTNVLLYQLIWAVPGMLVTEWTRVV